MTLEHQVNLFLISSFHKWWNWLSTQGHYNKGMSVKLVWETDTTFLISFLHCVTGGLFSLALCYHIFTGTNHDRWCPKSECAGIIDDQGIIFIIGCMDNLGKENFFMKENFYTVVEDFLGHVIFYQSSLYRFMNKHLLMLPQVLLVEFCFYIKQ